MKPFDREKAAQYFVVAWVKNWKLYTYVAAIGISDLRFEEMHDVYPWLPEGRDVHYMIKNIDVRAWCARAMKEINDKLWDTDDNKKRLALAKRIEHWDATGTKELSRYTKDLKEHVTDMQKARASGLAHKMSVDLMRRGNGHHWSVVK
jgi:hypothetical protein